MQKLELEEHETSVPYHVSAGQPRGIQKTRTRKRRQTRRLMGAVLCILTPPQSQEDL